MYKSIILSFCLIATIKNQETCWPQFILPNILKDSVTLIYNDPNENTYNYLYFAALLPGQIGIAYTINELTIDDVFGSLNYYLTAQINKQEVIFKFNAPNNKWKKMAFSFLLSSRQDLLIRYHTISIKSIYQANVRSEQRIYNFAINSSLSLTTANDLNHVTFINGLFCQFTNNIELSITQGDTTPNYAIIYVNAGPSTTITNITVVSIIFSTNSAQFVSISADLTYKSFQAEYYNMFKSFLPIYYYLIGLNSINLQEFYQKQFSYKFQLINLSIINATALNPFKNIIISYLAISAFPASVCCGNFFYEDQCIEKCVQGTYPHSFPDGGKACIKCDPLVGLKLNQLSSKCVCLPNYELLNQNQCNPIKTDTSCKGINEIFTNQQCLCTPGTLNISGTCSSCPNNQVIQNNQCVQRRINIICNTNEILQNNNCVCNINAIKEGSLCVLCPQKTFVDKINNRCSSCVQNCLKCFNFNSCLECIQGHSFNLSNLRCQIPSKTIKTLINLIPGFPKYTTRSIIVDFQLNIPNVPRKSSSQLQQIIETKINIKQFAPRTIQYIQNPSKFNHIRVLLNYYELYPISQFIAIIKFDHKDLKLNHQEKIVMNYYTNPLAYQI